MILGELSADVEGGMVGADNTGKPATIVPKGTTPIDPGQAALYELGLNLLIPTVSVLAIDRKVHPFFWWVLGPVGGVMALARYGIRKGMLPRP